MLIIDEENNIELTRGDTAYLEVPIMRLVSTDPDVYEEYEMQENDVLVFTMKVKYTDTEVVLQKQVIGGNVLHFSPSDTANKEFRKYQYDVEIRTATGEVFTVVPMAEFKLSAEVGW